MNKQPLHVYFALCIFIRLLLIYFAFIFLHNNIGNTLFTLLYAAVTVYIRTSIVHTGLRSCMRACKLTSFGHSIGQVLLYMLLAYLH